MCLEGAPKKCQPDLRSVAVKQRPCSPLRYSLPHRIHRVLFPALFLGQTVSLIATHQRLQGRAMTARVRFIRDRVTLAPCLASVSFQT